MTRVYVAGAVSNLRRAKSFCERVKQHPNLSLTLDWVTPYETGGLSDLQLPEEDRIEFAWKDLESVANADVLVVLSEVRLMGRGMYVELGFALGLANPPIIIVSGGGKRSIFTASGVVDYEFPDSLTDDEAFDCLCSLKI